MSIRNKYFHFTLLVAGALFFGNCGTVAYQSLQTKPARIGEKTGLSGRWDSLPPPREPIVVAVYQFRDQTGQYKPSDGGGSFSTAVTQGAGSILNKVLQDSKWFSPIERENIGDLLNERKIIRSTRQQFGINDELPALLYAGVLLEGGIVSYDANVITGGAGLRYFGTGGSSQYRQDRVTVYLRAISVSNGKILKTVYASKMILSQALDGGVFRYVQFKRLLEAETGFSYNEPSEMAVTEAIERAVETLIMEGIQDDLWEMKDPTKKKATLEKFKTELSLANEVDIFDQIVKPRRKTNALSFAAANLLYRGDYARGKITPGGALAYSRHFSASQSLQLMGGAGSFATQSNGFNTKLQYADLNYQYHYLPYYKFSPYLTVGTGVMNTTISGSLQPKLQLGLGAEYLLGDWGGLYLAGDYHYFLSDKADAVEQGKINDTYYNVKLGINLYFGSKIKDKKHTNNKAAKPEKGVLRDF